MPTEIQPGLYDITTRTRAGGDRRYRVFVFDDDEVTMFDTGHGDTTDVLFEGVEEIGVEPTRLVITHGDGDHVDGFDDIVDEYGVETYVPEQSDFETEHDPDVRVSDGDTIGEFTAVYTPGHCEDHFAYVHEQRGVAILGDAVFGADLRGLPEGYFVLPPAHYSEDLNLADESLETLLEYEWDVGLVYHGTSVFEGAKDVLEAFVNFPGKR